MNRTAPSSRALREDGLWPLIVAPGIWAAHLLVSYVTAAVWCAKFAGADGALNGIPAAIAWYTAASLVGILLVGWHGLRRREHSSTSPGTGPSTDDRDSPEDRRRFLGFATLLLSGLSAVAVLYVAFAATQFTTCR